MFLSIYLDSDHEAGVLVPVEQRVLAGLCLRILDVCPTAHKALVRLDLGEFASDRAVHVLHDLEVGGKQDVEVSLLYLYLCISHGYQGILGEKCKRTKGVETGIIRL